MSWAWPEPSFASTYCSSVLGSGSMLSAALPPQPRVGPSSPGGPLLPAAPNSSRCPAPPCAAPPLALPSPARPTSRDFASGILPHMSPCSNLRRLPRGDDAGNGNANGKMFPDWASLHPDLVGFIGCRVLAGDLQDYVRFRAVCSHWSASTARPGGRGVLDPRFHPRRWMMLPEGHGLYPGHPDLRGFVRFFNLDTGAFARAHLPLLADHVVLDSVDGLLLLHRNDDTAIRLLHPFTGDVAEFPPLASLLPQMEPNGSDYSELKRVRASFTVSSSGAITLVLALNLSCIA